MAGEARPGGLRVGFPADRAALIVYLMAGFPDPEGSRAALGAVARAGADIIELGVPYGDPLADGPVIAAAAAHASAAGFGLAETIELAAEFRASEGRDGPPVALMTYLNPLLRMGLGRAAAALRDAGVAGVIVPDMPPEAAGPWRSVAAGIDTVFLAAPTSTDERLATVGSGSEGFVYCVTTTGVTGERAELPEGLGELVARARKHTSLPVAAGFGVSSPVQAAAVARVADGVVVGSAVVRRQAEPAEVEAYVRSLAEAVRTARG